MPSSGAPSPWFPSSDKEMGICPPVGVVTVAVIQPLSTRPLGPKKVAKMGTHSPIKRSSWSVLTRTSVAINGVKGEITDIPEGKTVLIYWVPDEKKEGEYFARKIDVIFSEEELDEKYGKAD